MGTARIDLDDAIVDLLRRSGHPVEDEARDLIVTELYRRGVISRGRAASLLGMPLDAFLRYAANLGIPYVNYTEEEWEEEKRAVREMAAATPSSATPAR
jgi:predicted HTH domain antitoxin